MIKLWSPHRQTQMKVWLRSAGSQGCQEVQRGPDVKPELFLGLGPQSECRPPPYTSMSQTAFPPTLQLLSGSQNLPKQGKECGKNSLSVKQFFVVRSRWRWRENLQAPFFHVFLHKQALGPYCVQSQLILSWGGRKAALGKKGFLLAERKRWALNPKAVAPATGAPPLVFLSGTSS